VRLIYFDEAGTGSIAREPITTVAAVIVHGDREMPLINARSRELRNLLPEQSRNDFEFKADKMFRKIRKGGNESLYAKLATGFLEMMRELDLRIEALAIDRASFNERGVVPQDFAFVSVAAGIAQWLHQLNPPEGALVIADPSRSQDRWQSVIESIRRSGLKISDGQSSRAQEIPPLDHLVETIYFGQSRASVGIQMADYANFFFKMHMMRRAEAEPWYKIISPLFKTSGIMFARD